VSPPPRDAKRARQGACSQTNKNRNHEDYSAAESASSRVLQFLQRPSQKSFQYAFPHLCPKHFPAEGPPPLRQSVKLL
jgi:hypothetical protein